MSQVKLVWITPNAEQLVSDMARVSAPENQGLPPGKLLSYCVRNAHWSIFEMVNVCVEIETTRDIARQILRHRSFSFQEFSQRYAEVDKLPRSQMREARLQDTKNRQNSIETDDDDLGDWWQGVQENLLDQAEWVYKRALKKGIAKEVARAVLPEGLTTSRMYMNGTLRSWLHYLTLRTGNGTQKEHMEIAKAIQVILLKELPAIRAALGLEEEKPQVIEAPRRPRYSKARKLKFNGKRYSVKLKPKRLSREEKAEVQQWVALGYSKYVIANAFGIGVSTAGKFVYKHTLAQAGAKL